MEISIQCLPDEVLLCIFKNISTRELCTVVAEVCQRWMRVVEFHVVSVESLKQLETFHDSWRVLMVTQPMPQLDRASSLFGNTIQLVPRLQEITICKDYPLDKCDFNTLLSIKELKHLDVFTTWRCLDESAPITPTVTTVVINESVGNGFLGNLAQTHKLSGFHMYGRSQYFLTNEIKSFLLLQSTHLRKLTLRCIQFCEDKYKAISYCKDLESLQLHKCSLLTTRGIMYLLNFPKLRRFHLTGTNMVRSKTLLGLVRFLPPLIEDLNLSCSYFGNEHCDLLARKLPKLKRLELWRCPISNDGLLRLVQSLNMLEILDTDVCFEPHHLSALEDHPTLRKLKCLWRKPMKSNLDITSAVTVYPKEYLRGDGEGPSADLFYYWTRGINLKTFR